MKRVGKLLLCASPNRRGGCALRATPVWILTLAWAAVAVADPTAGAAAEKPGAAVGLSETIRDRFIAPIVRQAGEITIVSSPEAEHLLKSAAAAIERGDWKVALDAFARISDVHGDELLTLDGEQFVSARRTITELLAEMPPAGLSAYRLLNDGEASARVASAVSEHSVPALGEAVERYFHTSSGDQAAVLLATWLLDLGRWAEAQAVLHDVRQLYRESDVPAAVVGSLSATALALAGDEAAAEDVVSALSENATPANWAAAVDQLAETADATALSSGFDAWPSLMGDAETAGRMPRVSPTMVDVREWRVRLPVLDGGSSASGLPMSDAVSDGRVIIINAGPQLLAYDVETLQQRWATEPSVSLRWAESRDTDWHNQISRTMGVQGDLAFRIDFLGESVYTGDDVTAGLPLAYDPVRLSEFHRSTATRLVAYETSSGAMRWSRGRSPAVEDRLARVHFRCAPLAVGDTLVALYDRDAELFLGLLDPGDGRLLDEIVLCGLPVDRLSIGATQLMSATAGELFVSTRRGYLIAVDRDSFEVRWASRYGRGNVPDLRSRWSESTNEYNPPDGWLPTPPIVAGATILLAAEDADELVAFERQGGRIRWRRPRQSFRYLIAATGGTAWIAGKQVDAIDVETGETRWSQFVPPLTGRPALSGDRLLIPTEDGLFTLNASTGEVESALHPPPGHAALGNLLCIGGALFSVNEHDIRKYPDLDGGLTAAREALATRDEPVSSAIRAAWMEKLAGDEAAALAALDTISAGALTDILRKQHVRRLRVQLLLSLATATGDTANAASFLERAEKDAIEPADRVAVSLARADLVAQRGDALSAVTAFLELAESHGPAGASAAPGQAGTERLVRTEGADRHLFDILGERIAAHAVSLGDEGRATLQALLEAKLQRATDVRDYDAMSLYSALGLPFDIGARAALTLGEWEAEDERYEVAVGWQRAARAAATDGAVRAEAAGALASSYLLPILDSPLSAASQLEMFDESAEVAPSLAGTLDEKLLVRRRAERAEMPGLLPSELIRVIDEERPRPVHVSGAPPEWLERRLLYATEDGRLVCHELVTAETAWEASMRLNRWLEPGEAPDPRTSSRTRRAGEMPPPPPPIPAYCDGPVMVIRAEDGLLALGAATGRAIWYREMDRPRPDSPELAPEPLAAGDGYMAFMPRVGELEVVELRTGRPHWRRQVRPTDAARLAVSAERVLALSADGERIQLMRARDGDVIAHLSFQQGVGTVTPIVLDAVVCGPIGDGVVAYDLDTGEERWHVNFNEPIVDLQRAAGDYLAVAGPVGAVHLLDAATGDVRFSIPRNTLGERLVDVSVAEGIAVIAEETDRSTLVLSGYQPSDGKQLWAREFADDGRPLLQPGWLTDSPEIISLFFRKKQNLFIKFIDRRTGRRVSDDWRGQTREGGETVPILQRHPGRMVIGNGAQWWIYAAAPKSNSVGQM